MALILVYFRFQEFRQYWPIFLNTGFGIGLILFYFNCSKIFFYNILSKQSLLYVCTTTLSFKIINLKNKNLDIKMKAALVRQTSLSSLLHYLNRSHQRFETMYLALSFEYFSKVESYSISI